MRHAWAGVELPPSTRGVHHVPSTVHELPARLAPSLPPSLRLLREYIELEFAAVKLPFPLDPERVVDDYVLFCMMVGNDFLPCEARGTGKPPAPALDRRAGWPKSARGTCTPAVMALGHDGGSRGKVHHARPCLARSQATPPAMPEPCRALLVPVGQMP